MKLLAYLQKHEIPIAEFARQTGFSIYAVRKWIYKQRIPRSKSVVRITRATGGKVTGNDWLPDAN